MSIGDANALNRNARCRRSGILRVLQNAVGAAFWTGSPYVAEHMDVGATLPRFGANLMGATFFNALSRQDAAPTARSHTETAALGLVALLLSCVVSDAGASPQTGPAQAEQHTHNQHNMTLDSGGVVMNSNATVLPRDCEQMGPDYEFMVSGGTEFATDNPGTVYGFSQHEFQVEPCSRVTVTFTNKDQVRHQWMVHGLPKYLYPGGMFHLEAAGGHAQTATFIVPSDHKTYLVHCDVAQHMEKGMKGQLKVGRGSGDLWSIPGVSGDFVADSYLPEGIEWYLISAVAALVLIALVLARKNSSTAYPAKKNIRVRKV